MGRKIDMTRHVYMHLPGKHTDVVEMSLMDLKKMEWGQWGFRFSLDSRRAVKNHVDAWVGKTVRIYRPGTKPFIKGTHTIRDADLTGILRKVPDTQLTYEVVTPEGMVLG